MLDEESLVRTLFSEQRKLLAYIRGIVRRSALVEDIFQDVCALAVQKREALQDEDHLRAWLRVAARRQALSELRKRRVSDAEMLGDEAWDALDRDWRRQDLVDSNLYAELLRRCLGVLSSKHRRLVELRLADDFDYPAMAEAVGRPVASLYVTFSRIYGTLAKCIKGQLAVETEKSRARQS